MLNLTVPLEDWHLEALYPPLPGEDGSGEEWESPRIEALILDSSRITDDAAGAISECKRLRLLHVAETKVSSKCTRRFKLRLFWNRASPTDLFARPLLLPNLHSEIHDDRNGAMPRALQR